MNIPVNTRQEINMTFGSSRKIVVNGDVVSYYAPDGVINEFRFQRIRFRDGKVFLVVGNSRVVLDWHGVTIKPLRKGPRKPIVFT